MALGARRPTKTTASVDSYQKSGEGQGHGQVHPLRQVGYLFGMNSVAQAQTGVTVDKKKEIDQCGRQRGSGRLLDEVS